MNIRVHVQYVCMEVWKYVRDKDTFFVNGGCLQGPASGYLFDMSLLGRVTLQEKLEQLRYWERQPDLKCQRSDHLYSVCMNKLSRMYVCMYEYIIE